MPRNTGEHTLDVGLLDNGNGKVGDIVHAEIVDPVLETMEVRPIIDVVINVGLARIHDGASAIAITHMPTGGKLTAAEAHQLSVDLNVAADTVAGIRTQLGYDT